jgi:hypothetical protein
VASQLAQESDPARAFQNIVEDIGRHFLAKDGRFGDISLSMIALDASEAPSSFEEPAPRPSTSARP